MTLSNLLSVQNSVFRDPYTTPHELQPIIWGLATINVGLKPTDRPVLDSKEVQQVADLTCRGQLCRMQPTYKVMIGVPVGLNNYVLPCWTPTEFVYPLRLV